MTFIHEITIKTFEIALDSAELVVASEWVHKTYPNNSKNTDHRVESCWALCTNPCCFTAVQFPFHQCLWIQRRVQSSSSEVSLAPVACSASLLLAKLPTNSSSLTVQFQQTASTSAEGKTWCKMYNLVKLSTYIYNCIYIRTLNAQCRVLPMKNFVFRKWTSKIGCGYLAKSPPMAVDVCVNTLAFCQVELQWTYKWTCLAPEPLLFRFPFICTSLFGGGSRSSLRLRKSPWHQFAQTVWRFHWLESQVGTPTAKAC